MVFFPTFYLKYGILWSSDSLFSSLGFEQARTIFFLLLQSWPKSSKKCATVRERSKYANKYSRCHKVCIMASERNKRTSGTFFVNGGPVLASCKTPLTWKELYCLYFRKTKSEDYIVANLFGYTVSTAKATNASVWCSLHFEPRLLSTAFKQWRSSAMEMS